MTRAGTKMFNREVKDLCWRTGAEKGEVSVEWNECKKFSVKRKKASAITLTFSITKVVR